MAFAEASKPWSVEKSHPDEYQNLHKATMVVQYPWKLIVTPYENRIEFFNLIRDPEELFDIADQNRERVADLERRLDQWRQHAVAVVPIPDRENLRRLRSLGYIK